MHEKMIDIVVDYELDLAVTLSVVPIDYEQYIEWKKAGYGIQKRCWLISGDELQDITKQLPACGANIVEINTIRKGKLEAKGIDTYDVLSRNDSDNALKRVDGFGEIKDLAGVFMK